jgi:uncharacterized protein YlxP (DUF503 family)
MQIGVLTLTFHLPGCRSLKEKRQRLGGLRDRFGRNTMVGVCESGLQDAHQRAEWTFVAVGQNTAFVERTFADIEQKVELNGDANLTDVARAFV